MPRAAPHTFSEFLNPNFGFFYTVKKLIHRTRTAYQEMRILDTEEFGTTLVLDGVTQVAEKNDAQYHEPMVHPALCAHPNPRYVLVIGGGDGGILRETLKYPCVRRAEFAELDSDVVTISKRYLSAVHGNAFDDPRVQMNITDGRHYIERHRNEFDVVIMDMTDPSGPSLPLYTKEFYTAVKRSFTNSNGIFVMHSESPVSRPSTFCCIAATLRSVFSHVTIFYLYIQMYAVLWSVSVCSDGVDVAAITAPAINRRLKKYGIQGLKVYTGATHRSMQVAYPYIEELLRMPARIITDASPEFPDRIG